MLGIKTLSFFSACSMLGVFSGTEQCKHLNFMNKILMCVRNDPFNTPVGSRNSLVEGVSVQVRMTVLMLESSDKHFPLNQMGCTDLFPPRIFSTLVIFSLSNFGIIFFCHISSVEADSCPHSQPCVRAHFP